VDSSRPRFPRLSPENWHILLFLVDFLMAVMCVALAVLSERMLSSTMGERVFASPWAVGLLVSVSWPAIIRIALGPRISFENILRTGLRIALSAVACGGLVVLLFGLKHPGLGLRNPVTCLILSLAVLGLLSRWGFSILFGCRLVLRTLVIGPEKLCDTAALALKADPHRQFVGFLRTDNSGNEEAGKVVLGSVRQFDDILAKNAPIHSIVFLCDPETVENSESISKVALDCRIRQERWTSISSC